MYTFCLLHAGESSVSFTQPVAWNYFRQSLQLSLLCWTVGKAVFHWHPDVFTRFSTIVSTFRDAGWDIWWWDQTAGDEEHSVQWLSELHCFTVFIFSQWMNCVLQNSVSVLLKIQGLYLISYFYYWQTHFISCWKHIWACIQNGFRCSWLFDRFHLITNVKTLLRCEPL